MILEVNNSGSYSQLQYLLQLSYSENIEDQQKAAINLSKLVEGTVFPAVSFGPIAHALCRLIPSSNRNVASHAGKALKLLLLDDALRPQASCADVPAVVCGAIKQWNEEVICLREFLGALQTLCWDKTCIKSTLQTGIIGNLVDYIKVEDQEISILALATLVNIYQYSDTLLLGDTVSVELLTSAIPTLLEYLKEKYLNHPQRFYAVAALANASSHPRLASIILQHGGLQILRDVERQSLSNLHFTGSRITECAQTALYRLSDHKEGSAALANIKYSFKYGTKPTLELSFTGFGGNQNVIILCIVVWIIVILFTFSPLMFV